MTSLNEVGLMDAQAAQRRYVAPPNGNAMRSLPFPRRLMTGCIARPLGCRQSPQLSAAERGRYRGGRGHNTSTARRSDVPSAFGCDSACRTFEPPKRGLAAVRLLPPTARKLLVPVHDQLMLWRCCRIPTFVRMSTKPHSVCVKKTLFARDLSAGRVHGA